MIHIICGEEDFIISEKIIEISNNNFRISNFGDRDFMIDFQQKINKKLWGDNPFVVIRDFYDTAGCEPLYLLFKNYNPDVIFTLNELSNTLVKALKELKIPYKLHKIEYKFDSKATSKKLNFRRWAEEILSKYHVKLHPAAVEKLCEIFINSPAHFLTEIKKLSFYKKNQLITTEEIKALMRQPGESKTFEMVDYLKDKDFLKFFQYLKREVLLMGKPEKEILPLLGFLGSTIYRMLLVKKANEEGKIAEVDLNPYYRGKLLQGSYKFSEKELKYIYNIIAGIEKRYKKHQIKISDIPEEMPIGMSAIK